MAYSLQHSREKLPLPAISVLDTKPEVNFHSARFFIRETELESRIETITFQFWKIRTVPLLEATFIRLLTEDLNMAIYACTLIF